MRFSFFKHSETPLRKITDSFALGFILILAFREMQSHELTPSGFLLFMIVVRQTIAPISVFAQSLIRLNGGLGSARRVLELLKTQPEQKRGQHNLHDFKNKIEFNNVSFGYDPHRPVLRNINFSFMRGEVLAVVGSSGAGKSTLADLLVRLFDPLEGEILIDGVPITKYSLKSYRQLFGVVPQESLLNHLTVAENISFGDEEGASERLEHAIQIANAKEFIDNLPAKLDTPIGDRGVRLSGGQRQRLAIARAVYINPKVLVLDEATSALDSESERAVQIAINKILENSTAFIIAHRLSTIRHADRILVMNNGEIEAIGSAEDLIRTSPTYRKLYNLHFDMEKNA
jgi:ABC-type multidrug transport system fused ATPase/permease subunit